MRALETALLLAGGLLAALAIGPLRPRVAARGGRRAARDGSRRWSALSGGPRIAAAATGEFLQAVRAGRAPRLEAFGRVTARP